MKKLTRPLLIKIALILLIILMAIFIVKELQLIKLILIVLSLILPIFFGYVIAWLLKPIVLYFNRYMNVVLSTTLTYLLLFGIIGITVYLAMPLVIEEAKDLIDFVTELFELAPDEYLENIDLGVVASHVINWLNITITRISNIVLNVLYALFFAFFFLIYHQKISNFFADRVPHDLILDLSLNLKAFVKGTLITTFVLFILSVIAFYIIDMPSFILMAIIVSLTNVIPYIGPFIGSIPVLIIAFGTNTTLGLMAIVAIVIIQMIETFFVTPYVMSRATKINPILIMIGLIVFGYLFGIIGLIISTPVICILKTLYEYHQEHKIFKIPILDKLKD